MDALTEEQSMLMASLREMAEREFAEAAFSWQGETPWENVELLADRGFLGLNIDEAYGGGGLDELDAILSVEVVGEVCPDTAQHLYTQQLVGPRAIDMFGTEAAKERYLPRVTAGETKVAIAISEPGAGSDVGAMTTTVEEAGDDLVVSGEKMWVSDIPDSTAAVVWARFPDGLGSLIVDLDADGVDIEQHYTNMGGHTQTHFYLEDVRVPAENVLTRGSAGFKQQLKALNWERIGSATLANAWARCALDKALGYAQDREQFGQPIGDFQGIEWKLAEMLKEVEASRALTHRAARRAVAEDRVPDRLDAAIAKLYSSQMVERVVSEALQLHGANGYQQGHPLEYLYRVSRGRRLAAGTDEIQKNTIAAALKDDGLPPVA